MSNTIKTKIVPIGNSQGIRIPKLLLDQSGLTTEVELEVVDGEIIIRRANHPRAGWAEQFKKMAEEGDDQLLDDEWIEHEWDDVEWEWS